MKIDDLRTTLHDLADEAEDVALPDRMHGIDKHTRRDKLRRRATGAAAALMALTAVGVGVSGIDPWRDDSDPPVAQPEPLPDAAKLRTITEHGVRIEVNPGNARLIGHAVGRADDGRVEFEATATRGDWEIDYTCLVPKGTSMQDYRLEMTINGVPTDNSGDYCYRPGEGFLPLTALWWLEGDREARIAHMEQRFGVRPGESAQVELRLVDHETGDVVKDPAVLLTGAIYERTGEIQFVHGMPFDSGITIDGYNYRLIELRDARADRTQTFEVTSSSPHTLCMTKRVFGTQDGELTVEVVRPDGTTREVREYTGASGAEQVFNACQDGDTVRITPSSDVPPRTKLAIAVYEPAT